MRYSDAGIGPSSSPELKQHTAALAKVHKKMGTIGKTKTNPHFRSKYADLATICNELVGLLTEEGFAMPTYATGWYGAEMGWCCLGTLKHDSGEWTSTLIPLITAKSGMQDLGSAKTYAKRYALLDLVGAWVGEDDDDGNRAAGKDQSRQSVEPAAKKPDSAAMNLVYLQGAINAITQAETEAEAKKHLDTVRLRVKEKAVPVDTYQRCEAAFKEKWKQKEAING